MPLRPRGNPTAGSNSPAIRVSRADYHPQHEPMLYGWAQGQAHHWCGKRDQGTVWTVAKPRLNDLQSNPETNRADRESD